MAEPPNYPHSSRLRPEFQDPPTLNFTPFSHDASRLTRLQEVVHQEGLDDVYQSLPLPLDKSCQWWNVQLQDPGPPELRDCLPVALNIGTRMQSEGGYIKAHLHGFLPRISDPAIQRYPALANLLMRANRSILRYKGECYLGDEWLKGILRPRLITLEHPFSALSQEWHRLEVVPIWHAVLA
jgi:hypothetical protein